MTTVLIGDFSTSREAEFIIIVDNRALLGGYRSEEEARSSLRRLILAGLVPSTPDSPAGHVCHPDRPESNGCRFDECAAAGGEGAVTAELSARGRSNRRRGADAERQVAVWLRANGFPDVRRYLAGDGKQPGDLDWHPCIVAEVRDRADSRWPSWQRDALAQTKPGQACMVIRRHRGEPDPGRWTVRVHALSWLTVVRGDHDVADVGPEEWWPMTLAMAAADVRGMDA